MNRSLICQTLDDTGNDNLERLESIRFEFIKDRINNATIDNNTANGNYLRIAGVADIVSGDWRYVTDGTKVVNGTLKTDRIYCITKGIIFITPTGSNIVGATPSSGAYATNNAEDSLVFNIEELYKIPNNNLATVQFRAKKKIETIKGDIDVLSNFTNLRYVGLDNTGVSGDIKVFSGLTNLQWIALSNTNVSGDIKAFSNLTNLNILYINKTNVSGDISSIMDLPNIKRVYLPNTITHTDEQVKTLTDKGVTIIFNS